MRDAWSLGLSALPLVTTAIHAGHDLRPELAAKVALDGATRRREEDPFTDRITQAGGLPVVVHRSRFEVDLNRPRHACVYEDADAAFGLEVWREPLTEEQVERSRRLHDAFYEQLRGILDDLARQGPFVVLDIHSYNHRRDGARRPAAPPDDNPEVNIGTGSMDRDRWGHLVDRFMHDLGQQVVAGHHLDVAENVRFKGGYLPEWVHARYAGSGCALAIELKKVFMDEWSGQLDEQHLDELTAAFGAAVPLLLGELACGAA
jgi:N-formylglutamate deformylase